MEHVAPDLSRTGVEVVPLYGRRQPTILQPLVNSPHFWRLRVPVLLAALSSACSGDTSFSPSNYDAYYRGTWQLTGIIDGWVDTGANVPRPPTAEEARTWHVFSSEGYVADTARALATVEWGGRSGTGYWYLLAADLRLEATLTGLTGETKRSIRIPSIMVYPTILHSYWLTATGTPAALRRAGPPLQLMRIQNCHLLRRQLVVRTFLALSCRCLSEGTSALRCPCVRLTDRASAAATPARAQSYVPLIEAPSAACAC